MGNRQIPCANDFTDCGHAGSAIKVRLKFGILDCAQFRTGGYKMKV